jgi:hypothetical protein
MFIYIKRVTFKLEKKKDKQVGGGLLLLTLTDKRQTRPLVKEVAPQRQDSNIQIELISGPSPTVGSTPRRTDRPTVSRNVTSASVGIFVNKHRLKGKIYEILS